MPQQSLFPQGYRLPREHLGNFGELYRQWAKIRDEREFWQPVNVRFKHDPEWRNNRWSMQAMHDGVGIWGDVKVATMMMMGGAPFIWTAAAVVTWEAVKAIRRGQNEQNSVA